MTPMRPRIAKHIHRLADWLESIAWRIEKPWADDAIRRSGL